MTLAEFSDRPMKVLTPADIRKALNKVHEEEIKRQKQEWAEREAAVFGIPIIERPDIPSGMWFFTKKEDQVASQKLFQYAIVLHPRQTKKQSDEGLTAKAEIILDPITVTASDEQQVRMIAARDIPSEYENRLDQVEIIVRPF